MATRNLTKKFIDIRNANKANRGLGLQGRIPSADKDDNGDGSSDSGLLNQNDGWKANKASLPPIWVEKIEAIEDDISKIQVKMRELSALHTKRLMVNFETDEQQQEREIDHKTHQITDIFRHAEGLLKTFSKQANDSTLSASERKVRENMQRSIGKKLQGFTMQFRQSQKEYLNRLKAQKNGSGSQAFGFLDESKKPAINFMEIDTGFTNAQMQILDETEEIVNQRDEEITRIAKSIEELAQIFKELAVLVIDQGTILDRIDFNMESAVEHAKEGIVQLQKAEQHQKNALPLRCIVLLIVLIAIMLTVLIVKHTKTNSSDSSKKN